MVDTPQDQHLRFMLFFSGQVKRIKSGTRDKSTMVVASLRSVIREAGMFKVLLVVTATLLSVALVEFAPAVVAFANGTGP
jgi:hypothetical protein